MNSPDDARSRFHPAGSGSFPRTMPGLGSPRIAAVAALTIAIIAAGLPGAARGGEPAPGTGGTSGFSSRPRILPRADGSRPTGAPTREYERALRDARSRHPDEFAELIRMRRAGDPRFRQALRRLLLADRVMEALRNADPERRDRLAALRETDPRAFHGEIAAIAAAAPSPSPASPGRALHRRLREISRLYREEPDPDKRSRLRGEALRLIEQEFESRQAEARERIRRLRERLDAFEAELSRIETGRESSIARRLEEVTPRNATPGRNP